MDLCNLSCHLTLQFWQILRPSTHGFVQFVMSLDIAVLSDSTRYPWICQECAARCDWRVYVRVWTCCALHCH